MKYVNLSILATNTNANIPHITILKIGIFFLLYINKNINGTNANNNINNLPSFAIQKIILNANDIISAINNLIFNFQLLFFHIAKKTIKCKNIKITKWF